MLYCAVNGVENNQLSITDKGLAYGDGLFTTAKIQQGQVEMLDAHIHRLYSGSELLGVQLIDKKVLEAQLKAIAKNYQLAVLKVLVTSGCGGRGYARSKGESATIIVTVHEFPTHYMALSESGINLGISEQKLGVNPMLCGIKHLNRLEQVLIRAELDKRDEDDLVVCNIYNHVIEASSANLFWFKHNTLHTPLIGESGVAGLMRATILSLYPDTKIQQTSLQDLQQAEAMFLCNSVMGIMPVKCYHHQQMSLEPVKNIQYQVDRSLCST